MKYGLHIGETLIQDITDPQPGEIDLAGIEANLWNTSRFSNNPRALKVRQHTWLVEELAIRHNEPEDVVLWSRHHDDHEGVLGDWPGPLKSFLALHTPVLGLIENRFDLAICTARGIAFPSDRVRAAVHFYDKLAETLEWLFVLGREPAPWNRAWQHHLDAETAHALCVLAKNRKPEP